MAKIPQELALTESQVDEMMRTTWNMRIATVGPGDRINLTPLWFGWAGGSIYCYCRGQKVVNLRRNPMCTILVDRNERFAELQGAMFQGRAAVLEDADAEATDPHLAAAKEQMGRKYAGGHGEPEGQPSSLSLASARGRNWRWVRLTPTATVTWDNHKLPQR